ncbi:MAG: LLM class flavin-dependent oxidoreductase [Streptosporangiaceae bacterium]
MHVYSVTPPSNSQQSADAGYLSVLNQAATASQDAGWSGILVPHNLHEVDPWLVASHLGSVTSTLIPLLALQPACNPPHLAAACAAAYATLYNRPLYFNLVAGARGDEMRRIGDDLSHDERYERLREYGAILRQLLDGGQAETASAYYTYRKFGLEPRPDVLSQCRIFVAGSSPTSMSAATAVADVIVTHPVPFAEWRRSFLGPLRETSYTGDLGIRLGIIARASREEAWELATERFPPTWLGRQETLLKTRSPNVWARELAQRAVAAEEEPFDPSDPYWLGAFKTGQASAPFLVGRYEDVTERLAEYAGEGVCHLLLSGCEESDFADIKTVVDLVTVGQSRP